MRRSTMAGLAWAVCAMAALPASAQTVRSLADLVASRGTAHPIVFSPTQSATTVEDALRQMSDAADVIFTGEVAAIRMHPGVVEIDWHVETAVRGTDAGALLTVREWSGLWAAQQQRYLVGQRSLVMLHAPSVAGFSSPVEDGVLPLHGDAVMPTVDLRWAMTHVVRGDAAMGGGVRVVRTMRSLLTSEHARFSSKVISITALVHAEDAGENSLDAGSVDCGAVLSLLQGWNRSRGEAR